MIRSAACLVACHQRGQRGQHGAAEVLSERGPVVAVQEVDDLDKGVCIPACQSRASLQSFCRASAGKIYLHALMHPESMATY